MCVCVCVCVCGEEVSIHGELRNITWYFKERRNGNMGISSKIHNYADK